MLPFLAVMGAGARIYGGIAQAGEIERVYIAMKTAASTTATPPA